MASKRKKHPSQKELQEWFFYDPETGFLHWKQRPSNNIMWGAQAGGKPDRCGYLRVRFNDLDYQQHNLVWIMHNGDIPDGLTVDHENWNKADNRLDNLRLATPRQQTIHQPVKGFIKRMGCTLRPWQSQHYVDGRKISIGYFPSALQARLAYERYTNELEPEFASSLVTDVFRHLCSNGSPTVWVPS